MSQEVPKGLAVIQQQIKELDALAKQTLEDLNTVAGDERVAKWKVRTVMLITEAVGAAEGQKFAAIHPGPSFTNDLVEEFTTHMQQAMDRDEILMGRPWVNEDEAKV